MATLINRNYFINTYGTDVVCAYFDLGANSSGAGRYTSALYQICSDDDWVKTFVALRNAACLFKLPMDASASVDIVFDDAQADVRPAFFVEIHRSSHLKTAECTEVQQEPLSAEARAAVDEVKRALDAAMYVLPPQRIAPGVRIPVGKCADAACESGVEIDCAEGMVPECNSGHLRCVSISSQAADSQRKS